MFLPWLAVALLMNNYTGIQMFQLWLAGDSKSYRIAPKLLDYSRDLQRDCKMSPVQEMLHLD